MNLSSQYAEIWKKAVQIITDSIPVGGEFRILTEDEINESDEALHEAPNFEYVSKHGFNQVYAIYKITHDEQGIKFHGIEKGEEGDERTASFEEITTGWLCNIADLIIT